MLHAGVPWAVLPTLAFPSMNPAVGPWLRDDMRAALAERDLATVYRILSRYGWSQRRIAAAVGHTQGEVSEILHGRVVRNYDVLVRIADGFGIPRGWLGCAYSDVVAPVPIQRPRLAVSVDLEGEDPVAWLEALRSVVAVLERGVG